MATDRQKETLALRGGLRAVTCLEGKGQPKIGIEEFLSVATRFGFSRKTLQRIREAVTEEELGDGPFLANYYANLPETMVRKFERRAREIFGVRHALALSSGTAALHAAYVAAGVGPGTEVICPAIGFMATASSVVLAGGVPIFCDVDHSLAMDPGKIEALITPRTVAIAPTCVMGNVYQADRILAIARKHGLRMIEDCAQACGARYHGQQVGTIGDIGCFSISAYKIIGGGEGGLLLTNDTRLYERALQTAECGGLWRPERFAPPRYPGELFCGSNYRLSELEAAVDCVQIEKVESTARRFRQARTRILRLLRTWREIVPQTINDPEGEVGYLIRFYPTDRSLGAQVVEALCAEGISAGIRGPDAPPDWHLYSEMMPIILKATPTEPGCSWHCPHYRDRGGAVEYRKGDCPVADDLFDRVVNIPLNQWMNAADCRKVAAGINKVLSAFCTEDKQAAPWLP